MAIAGAIKEGATTVAASGGTDVTLAGLGAQNGKNVYLFSTDTSLNTARQAEFGSTMSRANSSSPGGFTQSRRILTYRAPKIKLDGTRVINKIEVTAGFDIETTAAEIETAMEQVGQMVGSAAFLPFWRDGNLN